MLLKHSTQILIVAFIFNVLVYNNLLVSSAFCDGDPNPNVVTVQNDNKPDIQWFKKEMKIDPKYTEKHEGILGMSWAHFFTMIFLVLFFFIALIAYHQRTTRTTRILEKLLKED